MQGTITIRNLRLTLPLGLDAWDRANKPQPYIVNLRLKLKDVVSAAETDDCSKTVSYSDIAKAVIAAHQRKDPAIHDVSEDIEEAHAALITEIHRLGTEIEVETLVPKGSLRVEGGYALRTVRKDEGRLYDVVDVFSDLKLYCVIGVNQHEREQKQMVQINLQLWQWGEGLGERVGRHAARSGLMRQIVEATEKSSFQTVEALALMISNLIRQADIWLKAIISVEKPNAIALADGCGVEIEEVYKEYPRRPIGI